MQQLDKLTNILLIAAMAGGYVKKSIVDDICEGDVKYNYKTIEKIKKGNYGVFIKKYKPRYIYLLPEAANRLEKKLPGVASTCILNKKGSFVQIKNDKAKYIDRGIANSQTLFNMQLAGIPFIKGPSLKEVPEVPIFYTPLNVKRYISKDPRAVSGSRMNGLLRTPKGIDYLIYNHESSNREFVRTLEDNIGNLVSGLTNFEYRAPNILIMGNGLIGMEHIMKNMEDEVKLQRSIRNGMGFNRVTGTIYSERLYYVPNGKEGTSQLELISKPEAHIEFYNRLAGGLVKERGGFSPFGYDKDGNPVFILIPLDLKQITTIKHLGTKCLIVVHQEHEEFLREHLGNEHRYMFVRESAIQEYLQKVFID